MAGFNQDDSLRAAMLAFANDMAARNGGVVTWQELQRFRFEERQIPLVGQKGIFKVRGHEAALTILTTYRLRPEDRPYADAIGGDGYPRYKWRGDDAGHSDNEALRRAMEDGLPVAWFEGVEQGVYLAHAPVWIVGEEASQQQFILALDQTMRDQWHGETLLSPADLALRREYAEVVVRARLHQPMFKRRVLTAYRTQCAMCVDCESANCLRRLTSNPTHWVAHQSSRMASRCAQFTIAHSTLSSWGSHPSVSWRLDPTSSNEDDGPTLRHALQGIHGTVLALPRRIAQRPDAALLEERYELFRNAG